MVSKVELSIIIDGIIKNLYKIETNSNVSHCMKPEQGDFTTTIAMKISSIVKQKSIDIANSIACEIKKNLPLYEINVISPGFINIFLGDKKYEILTHIIEKGKDIGKLQSNNIHVNIEYVSANPTGNLHIGHARCAIYGDVLANLLTKAGYNVTREYYVNDYGNQVKKLGQSIEIRYRQELGENIQMIQDGYKGKDIILLAKKLTNKKQYIDTLNNKEKDEFFINFGITEQLKKIKSDLANIGVFFNRWSSEKEIYKSGILEKVLEKLSEKDHICRKDGALWLKTSICGDEKDRVLQKQDGSYTYFTPDIAYHVDKIDRLEGKNKNIIDILGSDHYSYISSMRCALGLLGYSKKILRSRIIQMVRLIKDKKEVKMSKRAGNAVYLEYLIEKVGKDNIRYFFSSHSCDTQMDFDIDMAIKKSIENPLYYIKYAYARICSILKKGIDNFSTLVIDCHINKKFNLLTHQKEMNLINLLNCYEDTIIVSANKLQPYKIVNYINELASSFHSFYNKVIVIDNNYNYDLIVQRVTLLLAVKNVLESAFDILGIELQERM